MYLGDALPDRFRGAFLCCDFLQHSASCVAVGAAWVRRFAATYGGQLLDSRDTWFCAPDLCQGPDGAVYDLRLPRPAHRPPRPRRELGSEQRPDLPRRPAGHGRRSAASTSAARAAASWSSLLRHPNAWYAEQARVQLAARRDQSTWPALTAMARQTDDPRLALQGLWGLYVSGGFDDDAGGRAAAAPRRVRPRLDGSAARRRRSRSPNALAVASPRWRRPTRARSSAASSPPRRAACPAADGLPIVERLLRRGLDRDDPYIPLMLWWAIEAKALTDAERLLAFFGDSRGVGRRGHARERSAARPAVRRRGDGCGVRRVCAACCQPRRRDHQADALAALDLGLAERAVSPGGMGMAGLFASVAIPERGIAPAARTLRAADQALGQTPSRPPGSPLRPTRCRLRLAIRAGVADATSAVLSEAAAPSTAPTRRRVLLGILADLGPPGSVPVALAVLEGDHPLEVQSAALDVLARHGDDNGAARLLDLYPKAPPSIRATDARRPARPAGDRPRLSGTSRQQGDRRDRGARRSVARRSRFTAIPSSTPWCASTGVAFSPAPPRRNWPRSVA